MALARRLLAGSPRSALSVKAVTSSSHASKPACTCMHACKQVRRGPATASHAHRCGAS